MGNNFVRVPRLPNPQLENFQDDTARQQILDQRNAISEERILGK